MVEQHEAREWCSVLLPIGLALAKLVISGCFTFPNYVARSPASIVDCMFVQTIFRVYSPASLICRALFTSPLIY
jgi:hypothetical protein